MTDLTEADYEIDMEALMLNIGVDPGTVQADTAKIQFLSGKAVLTYTAIRAIPPKVLGVALLRNEMAKHADDEPDEPVEEPTPIKQPQDRKRTAKKTAK